MAARTRWKPRRVLCTEDAEHAKAPIEHVVKYVQGPAGAACAISEVVCGHLLSSGGVPVLHRRLVNVSTAFAASYDPIKVGYEVTPGLHFGTILETDVENGPPRNVDALSRPQDVVDIWAFDTWFCNIDRDNLGNILLRPNGARVDLIAADQSDCFGGAVLFHGGGWLDHLKNHRAARTVLYPQALAKAGALMAIELAIEKVNRAKGQVDRAVAAVPNEWWALSKIDPGAVEERLDERASRLPDLLPKEWQTIPDLNVEAGDGRIIII
jgi:hypothetical protein